MSSSEKFPDRGMFYGKFAHLEAYPGKRFP